MPSLFNASPRSKRLCTLDFGNVTNEDRYQVGSTGVDNMWDFICHDAERE